MMTTTASTTTMTDAFFGELYLRSTRPFLAAEVTEREAAFLRSMLPKQGRLLDLGCGHGRHLAHVPGFGVDRDSLSLIEARHVGQVARADLRSLPFRDGAFAGGWTWYNSLGTFEDDQVPRILAEVARCLAPGAPFVVHGSNVHRVKQQPEAGYDGAVGTDGDHLVERARYDFAKHRDEITRTLTTSDGRVLQAPFFIRYYDIEEWTALLGAAGLTVDWTAGGIDGAALEPNSNELILIARR